MNSTWRTGVYSRCEAPSRPRGPGAAGGRHGVRPGVTAVGVDAGAGTPTHVRRAAAARTRALACALAAGPGLDPGARRPGAGPRPAHHWRLAGGISPTRAGGTAGRAARR